LNDKAKENEIGRTCSANGGGRDCMKNIGGKAVNKEVSRTTKT
jgi:hypothetical protein